MHSFLFYTEMARHIMLNARELNISLSRAEARAFCGRHEDV